MERIGGSRMFMECVAMSPKAVSFAASLASGATVVISLITGPFERGREFEAWSTGGVASLGELPRW